MNYKQIYHLMDSIFFWHKHNKERKSTFDEATKFLFQNRAHSLDKFVVNVLLVKCFGIFDSFSENVLQE